MIATKSKKFLFILIGSQILICLLFAIAIFLLTGNFSSKTEGLLKECTIVTVEDRLKERVQDMIIHIEHKQKHATKETKNLCLSIVDVMADSDASAYPAAARKWMHYSQNMEYGQALSFILHDTAAGTITLFADNSIRNVSDDYNTQSLKAYIDSCPAHAAVSSGASTLYIFAAQEDIQQIAKDHAYEIIHATAYGENGYVWVNEIVNYDGGDSYAIRRIHPNLKETEGLSLSTNTKDVEGNLPYKTELEEIKKNGHIFHTYYFKNKSNDAIAEKASYAELYEPFNWIIATGEPLLDLYEESTELAAYGDQLFTRAMLMLLAVLLLIFAVDIVFIILFNKKYNSEIDTYVAAETKLDPLTGAYSRKNADTILNEALAQCKRTNQYSTLMMMDIDDFKMVNDTYGHDMGDIVLQTVSKELLSLLGDSDCLFRWGGEEFLLLCNNPYESEQRRIGEKILNCIRELSFRHETVSFKITLSIGSARFDSTDDSFMSALKRADQALYHSKHIGKNAYTNWEIMQHQS